jgi:hypothetical protein
MGDAGLPGLLAHVGESKYISLALGRIGNESALEALRGELRSDDWHRVEAAAKGLGLSNNPNAIEVLESARGSRCESTIAEVNFAFTEALAKLEKQRAAEKWLEVDRDRPWQQIQKVSQNLIQLGRDETKRRQAIAWWKQFKMAMPNLNIVIPRRDYPPNEAKARAWSCLASIIYYLQNPSSPGICMRCPDAQYCWEQTLKLTPGVSSYSDCLAKVS